MISISWENPRQILEEFGSNNYFSLLGWKNNPLDLLIRGAETSVPLTEYKRQLQMSARTQQHPLKILLLLQTIENETVKPTLTGFLIQIIIISSSNQKHQGKQTFNFWLGVLNQFTSPFRCNESSY